MIILSHLSLPMCQFGDFWDPEWLDHSPQDSHSNRFKMRAVPEALYPHKDTFLLLISPQTIKQIPSQAHHDPGFFAHFLWGRPVPPPWGVRGRASSSPVDSLRAWSYFVHQFSELNQVSEPTCVFTALLSCFPLNVPVKLQSCNDDHKP